MNLRVNEATVKLKRKFVTSKASECKTMIKEKSFALLKSMSTKCEYFNLAKLKRMRKQDSEYEAKSERENEVSEKSLNADDSQI